MGKIFEENVWEKLGEVCGKNWGRCVGCIPHIFAVNAVGSTYVQKENLGETDVMADPKMFILSQLCGNEAVG